MKKLSPTPSFLNVDLEIRSKAKLDSLAAAMGNRVILLFNGPLSRQKNLLAVETSSVIKKPDAAIHKLCDVIEKLPPAARKKWDAADKQFDIGHDLLPSERHSRFTLRNDTLQRVASIGAGIAITCYRGEIFQKTAALKL